MASEPFWNDFDRFAENSLLEEDPILQSALEYAATAGLPNIHVSPLQGRFLELLAAMVGARCVLEIGTLAGYSTICLARGLAPGGHVITIESDPGHARVAQENITRAGLGDRIELIVGRADEVLPSLAARAPFDLVFIDADKANTPLYFEWSLQLSRAGSVIVVDNVVRDGAVLDAASVDPGVVGIRAFFADAQRRGKTLRGTALQTVGSKGYDGFALFRVVG